MAEFVMKELVKKAGLESQSLIESAATSTEGNGNPVYPPARRKLAEHGIDCAGKTARQLTNADYNKYDLLIGMDRANLRNIHRICGGDYDGKMHLLMGLTNRFADVATHGIQMISKPHGGMCWRVVRDCYERQERNDFDVWQTKETDNSSL